MIPDSKMNILYGYSGAQLTIREFSLSSMPQEVEGRYPLRLKASLLILVLSGEAYMDVNYQSHTLKKDMIVQFTEDDIILNISHSPDFTGFLVLISPELRSEIKSITQGARQQKAARLKRVYPIQKLDEQECKRVVDRIRSMQSYLSDETHLYRSLIIRNEVLNLFLDLDNSRTKRHGDAEVELTHTELLREKFRELLVEKCRQHRDVAFYARELCVTPDYLSRVVREYDGGSAMKWIANAVVAEAKYLLRQQEKTINQIAFELSFPDQSTFGKFFKKYTGVGPREYRKVEA